MPPIKTIGLSPKVIAPILTALSAVVTSWVTTGDLSRSECAVLAVAVIGALAAYLAPPGEVDVPDLHVLPLDDEDARDPAAGVDEPELA